MLEKQRHKLLLDFLDKTSYASVSQLCDHLRASPATIRRDITKLSELERLRKIRGGAEALQFANIHASTKRLKGSAFENATQVNTKLKKAIAQKAVDICEENEPIIINAGSTTFMMVQYLRHRHLHILTNSFELAYELVKSSENQVSITGGEVYRKQRVVVSSFDDSLVENYHCSKMFLSSQGVNSEGLMESDPLLVQTEKKLMRQADSLILLADSSKFSKRGNFMLCDINRIDVLITDSQARDADVAAIERAGVKVIIVDV